VAAGYPRSALIGATFAAAWSPCIGPILGAVLTLAAASGTAVQGGVLLVSYSLGLGIWFLAFGAAFGWIAPRLRRIQRYLPALMAASGALFIVVGAAMFLGEFGRLNGYFRSAGFLFSGTADAEAELVARTGGLFGPAVAAFGGVVSFLSPCVLPLVPVYLANLAGEAAVGTADGSRGRTALLFHAAAFVAGFTAVFALLGVSAGLLGQALLTHIDVVTRAGGVILIALGLQMAGLVHFPYLDRTYQLPVPDPAGR
jgi:cytochrome c biogenesis protein CcdA